MGQRASLHREVANVVLPVSSWPRPFGSPEGGTFFGSLA